MCRMATSSEDSIRSKEGIIIDGNSGTSFPTVTVAVPDCFQSTTEDHVSFALKNTLYRPSVVGVKFQTPALHAGVPLRVLAPVIDTDTVAASPGNAPHAPPMVVTVAFVVYGNVRAVPFTLVSVTTGAVLSTVIDFAPLVPVFPAVSAWVAVTV